MLNEGPMTGPNNDYLQRSLDSLRSAAAVDFRFNFVTNGSPTPSFVAAAAAANHHYATSGAPAFFYTNRNNVIIEPSDLRFFGGAVPTATTTVETATATTTANSSENTAKIENQNQEENGTAGEESIDSSSTNPSPVSVGESVAVSNQNSYDDEKAFISKAEMQIHQQAHMREAKPYKCSQCCKAFANSSYLSQHTRIHLGIKPYRCEICQRKFTQLSHLQQHIRTHTGDKPYKCRHPGCQKAFSQLSNLQSHSRCHQTDKPYKCNSCYKCFSDENALLDHIPKHKESKHLKTHICQFCGKSYTQETYLNKHLQKHTERPPDKPQHHQQRPQLSSASAIAAVAAAAAAGGLNLNAAHHHHHHHRNLLGTGSHHPGLEHHPYWSKLSPESGATPENLHDYSSELQRQIIEQQQQQQQQQQHVQQQNDEMLRQQQQSPVTPTLSNTNYDNVNKVMTSSAFTPISVMSQMPSNQLQLNNRIITNASSGPAYLYDPISYQKNNSPTTPQNPLDLNKSSQTSTSTSNNTGAGNGQQSSQSQENAPPQQQNNTPSFAVNNHLISLHQIRSYQQHPAPPNSNAAQNSLDHNAMLVGAGGGTLKDKN